jgi:hypothetical protein
MKTVLLLILGTLLRAQTITLSAPATVPSGQPIPLTVTYSPGSQPYWENHLRTQRPDQHKRVDWNGLDLRSGHMSWDRAHSEHCAA